MLKMKSLCVILLIGILLVTACKKGEEKEGKVLAKVEKTTLTMEDFLQQIPPQMLMQTTAENRQAILDNWVANEIIYKDALKKGLLKDPEIKERLEQIEKQLLTRAYMQEILEEVQFVSDIEARSYFEKHKDEFNSIREVSHMSFNSKAEAEAVLEQLKKGASFYQLAQKHSTDPETAQNGGRLGSFRKGELTASYPLFEEAVFSIKKAGGFSDVVQTEFNYDIIKLHSIKQSPVEYEDVAQSIMLKIRTEKFQQRSETLVDSLKEVYSYEIYPEVLEKELGIPPVSAPGLPTPTE
jgi:EpsD family peptidyl-prolyl cis-trans isomerase